MSNSDKIDLAEWERLEKDVAPTRYFSLYAAGYRQKLGEFLAYHSPQLRADLLSLREERDRLQKELDLWKPLTVEEAQKAYDEAEAIPLSEERINELVRIATDPAVKLPNNEQAQLAVALRKAESERDRLLDCLYRAFHGGCSWESKECYNEAYELLHPKTKGVKP